MNSWKLAALVAALFVGLAACSDDGQVGTPLSVSLIGPDTGTALVSTPFLYDVSGRSLSGLIFEWGDGTRDSLPTAGAQSAQGSRPHTYDSAGSYTVLLVAEDAIEGTGSAQATVLIGGN